MASEAPRRGDVWWIAFGASQGGEPMKTRPAIIVSNDAANEALDRLQVVPLTTNVSRVYPSEALVTVLGERRKAAADQITTAAKSRVRSRMTRLSSADLAGVERAIRVQLQL